ncbi:MAG: App1 family protein [Verrucomicrobiales bacterium]
MDWKNLLTRSGHNLDDFLDGLERRLERRTGFMEGAQVLPYRTFGNASEFYIKGRALRKRGGRQIKATDTVWLNMLESYRRFHSVEIPHAEVKVEFGRSAQEIISDEEGYFECALPVENVAGGDPWKEVKITLLRPETGPGAINAVSGHVLVPPAQAQFGIISDIDDTVLVTEARQVFRMFASTFLKNAHTRLPFGGVAAFYRALQRGPENAQLNDYNPIFYVSSGPWNLYDLLRDFFEANQIPVGPICLQDFGFDRTKFVKSSHQVHKVSAIKKILEMYPHLPFVLLGDSGQKDPEIYLKILQELPTRIKAIYIRDVADAKRTSEVNKLFDQTEKHGGELLLVKNSFEAAKHACERGWISHEALNEVRHELNLPEDAAIQELAQETAEKIQEQS